MYMWMEMCGRGQNAEGDLRVEIRFCKILWRDDRRPKTVIISRGNYELGALA